jgi:UDP-N-acetylmuramyl tripeptide synthase
MLFLRLLQKYLSHTGYEICCKDCEDARGTIHREGELHFIAYNCSELVGHNTARLTLHPFQQALQRKGEPRCLHQHLAANLGLTSSA